MGYKEKIFYKEGAETLKQVAQRRCPIIGSGQGQAGRGFEQPGLAEDGLAQSGLD